MDGLSIAASQKTRPRSKTPQLDRAQRRPGRLWLRRAHGIAGTGSSATRNVPTSTTANTKGKIIGGSQDSKVGVYREWKSVWF